MTTGRTYGRGLHPRMLGLYCAFKAVNQAAITLALVIGFAAPSSGDELRFPPDQFGQANLALPQSLEYLETALEENADNFELVGGFTTSHRFRRLSAGVGRLDLLVEGRDGEKWVDVCTASLISKEYILTAYHCFFTLSGRRLTINAARFRLGYLSSLTEHGEDFSVKPVPVESDKTWDYAILELEEVPTEQYKPVRLALVDPLPGQELFILHHPLARALRVTRRFCRAVQTNLVTEQDFRHRCDTLGGSSGAPVFSDADDVVIGLHYKGGLSKSPDSFNSAKRLKTIAARSEIIDAIINLRPKEPGVYLSLRATKGQKVTERMFKMVGGADGRPPDDGVRPYAYDRDIRGTCFIRNLPADHRLAWADVGLCRQFEPQ